MYNNTYPPQHSNYHDHLCTCPGCNYDGPEPSDEEIAQWESQQQPESPYMSQVLDTGQCFYCGGTDEVQVITGHILPPVPCCEQCIWEKGFLV